MTPSKPVTYEKFESGRWEVIDSQVIVEMPVSLTVNGEVWLTFMCTPVNLEAMAIGFLFNEKVIEGMDEVVDVRVCEHGDNVDVWLTHSAEKPTAWRRTSGCTGGVTSQDVDDPGTVLQENGALLTPAQISHLVELLFESQEIYKETGGVHTSALSDGQQIIISAEDIGRHNTLDKIAGLYLMQKPQMAHKVLLSTGRVSSEMLQKASRMGASILMSRTSPSSLSISMAEKSGITLIGYARRHRFNVYTHPQRILAEENLTKQAQNQA